MKLSDEMLTEISYVNMSVYRTRVMKSLDKMPKIPRQLADDTDINIHHVSNTLTKLKEHELVECINPEMRKGRVYRLTDKGEELAKNIDYLKK